MTEFVQVPMDRLAPETLGALLEDVASREGTDYGERETPLDERVAQLRRQLVSGEVLLLFHGATESWDLCPVMTLVSYLQAKTALRNLHNREYGA